MEYLDFELPVKELQEQIAKCQAIGNESSVDVTETCKLLKDKLETAMKSIYGNLTPWQKVHQAEAKNSEQRQMAAKDHHQPSARDAWPAD